MKLRKKEILLLLLIAILAAVFALQYQTPRELFFGVLFATIGALIAQGIQWLLKRKNK